MLFLAELMRFSDYIPPFTGASPEQAHTGLNYASGGAGILEDTSYHLVRTYFRSKRDQNKDISLFFLGYFIFTNTNIWLLS